MQKLESGFDLIAIFECFSLLAIQFGPNWFGIGFNLWTF